MTFESKTLGELCTKITDGSHYSPKELAGGIPMYSVKDMTQFGFSDTTVKRISEDDYEALTKADCTPMINDVLIAKDGSVLKHVFSIESEVKGALLSSISILRPNQDLVNSNFLAYALQDPVLRNDVISNYVSGSGVPRIVLKDFKNISIKVPPLKKQIQIALLLKSLDRRIQNNNALCQTLEDIAQAYFKSWFIDFDPVTAKISGSNPVGMDEESAWLFPDSMNDSEFGPFPKGWESSTIGSLCETRLGGTPSRARMDFWGGDIPWINSGKVNEFRITSPSEYITESGLAKSATKLLPRGTTVLAITGATLGQFSRLEFEACANQSVVGIIGSERASDEFIYLSVKNNINRLISAQTGGAQQHINKEDINAFAITYPGQELMRKFTELIAPLFSKIGSLALENDLLAEVRGSILPRLISGQLQIPEEILAS